LLSVVLLFFKRDPIGSVILGLGVAILFQLYDMQRRQSASEERILQATALSQALYRDEWLSNHIRQIVDDYLLVKNGWFELFSMRANDAIVECRDTLTEMVEGHIIAPAQSSYTFSREAFEKAKKFVNVTSVGDITFWRNSFSERYLEQNAFAVHHGVPVTRIFIQPLAKLKEGLDVLEKHRKVGIDVYVVQPENLPPELIDDFLIMDNRVVIRVEFASDGRARAEKISIDKLEVERAVKKFETLIRHARKLDDVFESLKT
jgi:hypothetical protein